MPPLDPIVSLSVAVAEAPGSYAMFLGSGVSRDAGVPTGDEVFWTAVGELWRTSEVDDDTPDREGLKAWLVSSGRADSGYSDILAELTPDLADRRAYLAKHFASAEPGPTHHALAELAHRGLVRVFITTNFDRLLERALVARGLEPVMVTSDADLSVAPSREHHRCFVLKPHGDYLQETIRNTRDELAQLEPAMADELQRILDRYGVVVLGYSGSDQAIRELFKARRSRYGLYWVARSPLQAPALPLVEATGGRTIQRPDAATFLADLSRRLDVFSAHPSGQTPLAVHDEVVQLLRRGDTVGVRELLRQTHQRLEDVARDVAEKGRFTTVTPEVANATQDTLRPAIEQRLAGLLPLLTHAPELLVDEARALADLRGRAQANDGTTYWTEIPVYCVELIGAALCVVAARRGLFRPLEPLLTTAVPDRLGDQTPLLTSVADMVLDVAGKVVVAETRRPFSAPWWEALRLELRRFELLAERCPELRSTDDLQRSMTAYDLLLTMASGLHDYRAFAVWTLFLDDAQRIAGRLYGDQRMREDFAGALGLTLGEFNDRASDLLSSPRHVTNGYSADPHLSVIARLMTGKRG